MIRINLLPGARRSSKASPTTGSSPGWIIAYLVAAAITMVVLVFFYLNVSRKLNQQQEVNRTLQADIEELQRDSANIDEVRAELERSRQLEGVVNDLQRARYGPTSALMELSRILSVGGGPTIDPQRLADIRRENPLASHNTSWDPRRLWLIEFREEERACHMTGIGKTNEDVAEFLRRLSLSERFDQIELIKTEGAEDPETNLPVISFELSCRVIY